MNGRFSVDGLNVLRRLDLGRGFMFFYGFVAMGSFIKRIFDALAPSNEVELNGETDGRQGGVMSRQAVLDALLRQFDEELEFESTKVSMLFHTSFVVYLREADYLRIAPSFQITSRDAVTLFLDSIKSRMKRYPSYRPHSRYWVFQLVCLPEGMLIDDVPAEEMDDHVILIKSSIFPSDDYESGGDGSGGRVVTTMHTKSSMVALPKAFNIEANLGMDQLSKDRYRIRFDQDDVLGFGGGGGKVSGMPSIPVMEKKVYARLTADDGRFVENGRVFTTYQVKDDVVKICGRNAVVGRDEPMLCVDSDVVMNPHCIIRRDSMNGCFYIAALGSVVLNERRLQQGVGHWVLLPNNSSILLNGDVQIGFKVIQ